MTQISASHLLQFKTVSDPDRIIGVGALLRYAFANIDVPPEIKMGSGALAAAALGLG